MRSDRDFGSFNVEVSCCVFVIELCRQSAESCASPLMGAFSKGRGGCRCLMGWKSV